MKILKIEAIVIQVTIHQMCVAVKLKNMLDWFQGAALWTDFYELDSAKM